MNYTYEILQYRPQDLFLQVQYLREGYPPIIRNLNAPPPQELHDRIKASVPLHVWEAQDVAAGYDLTGLDLEPKAAVWEPPPVPEPPPPPTQEEQMGMLQKSIVDATQLRLDEFARTRNYDGILSACTYATSTVPQFQAEGQRAVNLRDATWSALYTILAEVQAGKRSVPTGFADIEPDLPVLTWLD